MAKFVDTTWAACLARQKPVSTSAKPGLHEDDEHGADHDPQQVHLRAEGGDRIRGVLGKGRCRERECQRADDPYTREQLSRHQLVSLRLRARGRGQLMWFPFDCGCIR